MFRESLAEFLLQKVRISASQEEILNAIPGWEAVAGIIDDTPSQPESPGSQQRIFDVAASSLSDEEEEEDLSHKPVEWASPEPTPKAARHVVAGGLESYHEPFDSDRSQSPKRRLSWGFSRLGDVPESASDQPDADADAEDKVISIVDTDQGVTEALHEKMNVSVTTSTDARHVRINVDDVEDARGGANQGPETWGEPLSPEAADEGPSRTSKHSEAAREDSLRRTIAGNSSEGIKSSGKAARLTDGYVGGKASRGKSKTNEKMAGSPPQIDSRSAHTPSLGKSLRADSSSSSSSSSSSESEDERRNNPSIPPKAVQEKLKKIRRLRAEEAVANQPRKRGRGEHKSFSVPEHVMDVVTEMAEGKPAPIFGAADLLSAALRADLTHLKPVRQPRYLLRS